MKPTAPILIVVLCIILVLCCCLILILCGTLAAVYKIGQILPTIAAYSSPFPGYLTPTPFEITRQPVGASDSSTLEILQQTIVPVRDLALLACRFKHICGISPTVAPPASPLQAGAKTQLWVMNSDTNVNTLVNVTLHYVTPHAYFWVEDGIQFNQDDAEKLIDTFENKIYPTDREFFGSEWTPGVDGDPHIYIVYARNLGSMVAGFFSPGDEYPPEISEYSNAHETFYIDSSQGLAVNYTYGTLAHEFQHMIHWYQDMNESSFLNEGFAELATFLNGYDTGGNDYYYTINPDINLTDWLGEAGDNYAHYGANFLFVTYFLDRFGEQATKTLVHDQQNSLESVDNVLGQLNISDPLSGQPIRADDFFLDWTIANYLQDPSVSDGRYTYHNYPDAPSTTDTEGVSSCPSGRAARQVNQYGVDYIRFNCSGDYTIDFTGSTLSRLLPADPHGGSYAFWSNMGDESNMTLTRQFDLTGVTGQVTFTYWVWYDLESNYDYVYLDSSIDGTSWKILSTPSGTEQNPSGGSYGWGYTGKSNGWIQESIDLSQFTGHVVSLRFDYITDAAVNNEGFMVDDISIPEIGYSEGFESGTGGWEGSGFVRIQNVLPQTFRLALITIKANETKVDIIPVSSDQTAQIPVTINKDQVRDVILVVTATTRYTREQAAYQFEIR
jgi:immune inhibitor A